MLVHQGNTRNDNTNILIMDTTEMHIKIIEVTEEFEKLQYLTKCHRVDDIPRLCQHIDSLLWYLKDAYGYVVTWEPQFRTIIKKWVDITDIKVS